MFLSSYEKLRIKLQKISIVNMAHLGARAFEEIAGEVVQTSSFILSKKNIRKFRGVYSRLVDANNQSAKEELFLSEKKKYVVNQDNFNKIPGNPITYWASEKILKAFSTGVPLSQMAIARNGVKTGDNQMFVRMWQEINYTTFCTNASDCHEAIKSGLKWFPYNKGGESRRWYGNNDYVVDWQYGGKRLFGQAKIDKRNVQDYPDEMKFTPSCTWSLINTGTPTFRFKEHNISDIAGMSFYQAAESNLYLLGLCNSPVANAILKLIAPTINYQAGDIGRIPVLLNYSFFEQINKIVKELIELSIADWDSFESSWDFKRHPLVSAISKNRALFDDMEDIDLAECYTCWENECNERFNQLKANEEELNRIFIDIYGLQDELTPEGGCSSIAGLWCRCYGSWKRCICYSPIRQVVHE